MKTLALSVFAVLSALASTAADGQSRNFFLARPRRFGKSLMISNNRPCRRATSRFAVTLSAP